MCGQPGWVEPSQANLAGLEPGQAASPVGYVVITGGGV